MARKGKDKPKLDPGRIGSTLDSFLEEEGIAVAPTTLCSEHVRGDDDRCARCGMPLVPPITREMVRQAEETSRLLDPDTRRLNAELGRDRTDEWEERIDAARQSETRGDDNALDAFLTEDEKQAPYAAVLTAEQLDAVLETPAKPALDGFQHILVAVLPLWHQRAVTMAEADGFTVGEFIERLIKRQWIASGAASLAKGRR